MKLTYKKVVELYLIHKDTVYYSSEAGEKYRMTLPKALQASAENYICICNANVYISTDIGELNILLLR